VLDTPSSAIVTSEAEVMSYAGQDTSLISQSDSHQAAAHTYASVSGQTTSLFTHEGGMKVYAANGPVSLQAHTDELQIWADKDVTVISVNDQIGIHAKTKIELMAGQSGIVLEGGNITLTMPGQFTAKGSAHAFLGGGSNAAELTALPDSTVKFFDEAFILVNRVTGEVMPGVNYRIKLADGTYLYGRSDEKGRTELVRTLAAEKLEIEVEAQ
jgi:type VI secretion system secreted protein VgrG